MTGNILWYIIAALGVIVIGALGLIVFLLIKRSRLKDGATDASTSAEPTPAPAKPEKSNKVVGILEMEDGTRHVLDADAYLIGRHSSNDLTLADPSVSRQHAELNRHANGTFQITDLDSMNGVFVDNKQLKSATLTGDEQLEFGDVACRFRIRSEGELDTDQTQAIQTQRFDDD